MLYQVSSDEGATRSYRVPATLIAVFSLGLGVAIGALSFVKESWLDNRLCAALSSAWFNAFTIALAAHLAEAHRRCARNAALFPVGIYVWRSDWWRKFGEAVPESLRSISWQPWAVLACSVVSALAAWLAWHSPVSFQRAVVLQSPATALAAGLGACALAFGTLVVERSFAIHAERGRAWTSIANVLRAAILTALIAAMCEGLSAYAGMSPVWPAQAIATFNAAIALEFALRAVFSWFAPPPWRSGDASVPDSLVASLLRFRPSPLARFSAQLRHRYGIDLRQNWALQRVVCRLPAAIAMISVGAWLLTGVSILGPDQRAVYERFGAPVAVWQPGVHLALPWPFGKSRIIDNGAVHQLAIAGTPTDDAGTVTLIRADAQTPARFNRLWDVAHQGETTQVIAGVSGDRQNFQIVSADVRLDYRIGLSDAAARDSLYRTADVFATVQAIANREVVRYLASHTLDSLLETRQSAMASSIRHAVQAKLDEVASGIDVVAVVIESVHPPAGAAAAWHSVQAAQIRAEASVAQARGLAAEALGDAQERAYKATTQADSQAADITAAARMQEASFRADTFAAQAAGPAFVLEYYLHNLRNSLRSAHVTVIDDRLADGNRITIDLRPYGAGTRDAAGAQHID